MPHRSTLTGKKAFSLVELAVTLTVTATLSALMVLWFSANRDSGGDAEAKASLTTFVTLQEDSFRRGGQPLTAAELTGGDYDRGSTTFTAGASDAPDTVSITTPGDGVVIGAAQAGADCWGVRLDFTPVSGSPRTWWYVAINAASCDATAFTGGGFPGDGTGQRPSKPTLLD